MNIPNTLTLARIVLVPLVVWLIVTHEMTAAFVLFLLAGFSDAADGYLAKRFQWRTELGAYLDPIADKLLLMSIYVTLGFSNHLPAWLVIAVVSRDILIIGAFLLSWVLSRPVPIHPLLVSKLNTFAQIVLAGLVLAELGLGLGLEQLVLFLIPVTGALTIVSAAAYFWGWLRHMASYEPRSRSAGRPERQIGSATQRPGAVAGQGFVTVKQLSLDLPHRAALGAEDFLVSECNRGAVRLIDTWPEWKENAKLIIGPAASGKTHLARVWQARSGAEALSPTGVDIDLLDAMGEGTALIVEDIDRAGNDEKALFHLLNLAREKRCSCCSRRGTRQAVSSSRCPI